jgi:hypothetical protein
MLNTQVDLQTFICYTTPQQQQNRNQSNYQAPKAKRALTIISSKYAGLKLNDKPSTAI